MIPTVGLCCILIVLFFGVQRFNDIGRQQELLLTESALEKAIVQCYAIEGIYPADVSYLEENYNLTINKSKYNIFYECFSSNIMPEYGIYERK
jgi:hypothetical protein